MPMIDPRCFHLWIAHFDPNVPISPSAIRPARGVSLVPDPDPDLARHPSLLPVALVILQVKMILCPRFSVL